jgi:hypothetical protein
MNSPVATLHVKKASAQSRGRLGRFIRPSVIIPPSIAVRFGLEAVQRGMQVMPLLYGVVEAVGTYEWPTFDAIDAVKTAHAEMEARGPGYHAQFPFDFDGFGRILTLREAWNDALTEFFTPDEVVSLIMARFLDSSEVMDHFGLI